MSMCTNNSPSLISRPYLPSLHLQYEKAGTASNGNLGGAWDWGYNLLVQIYHQLPKPTILPTATKQPYHELSQLRKLTKVLLNVCNSQLSFAAVFGPLLELWKLVDQKNPNTLSLGERRWRRTQEEGKWGRKEGGGEKEEKEEKQKEERRWGKGENGGRKKKKEVKEEWWGTQSSVMPPSPF